MLTIHCSQDQFGQMAVQATRYALGRRTHAPMDTRLMVQATWEEIPRYWRDILWRDVREAIDRAEQAGSLIGDQCDHDQWTLLNDWITGRERDRLAAPLGDAEQATGTNHNGPSPDDAREGPS